LGGCGELGTEAWGGARTGSARFRAVIAREKREC
jgi:hypothetical protein